MEAFFDTLLKNETSIIVVLYLISFFIISSSNYEKKKNLLVYGMLVIGHFLLNIASLILQAYGYQFYSDVKMISHFLGLLALINTFSVIFFSLFLPKISIKPPLILQELLVVGSAVVTFFTLASQNGYNISGLIATSAIFTAIIGLALQDTLTNLMAGLSLQLDNSIKEGDWIKMDTRLSGKVAGKVVQIRWRYTALQTRNWETVLIPNTIITKSTVTVLGKKDHYDNKWRSVVFFNVDYRYSPALVIESVLKVLRKEKLKNIYDTPEIQCTLDDFQEDFCQYAVRYWIKDFGSDLETESEVRALVYYALKRADIYIKVPDNFILPSEEQQQRRIKKYNEELNKRIEFLGNIELFKGLSSLDIGCLAEELIPVFFKKEEIITKQGDEDHWLYIVKRGHVSVNINYDGVNKKVGELKEGDFFGEMSLLTGAKRTATIQALSEVECYKLEKEPFREILEEREAVAIYIAEVLANRTSRNLLISKEITKDERLKHIETAKKDILNKIKEFFSL